MDRVKSSIRMSTTARLTTVVVLALLLAACQGRLVARGTLPAATERVSTPVGTAEFQSPAQPSSRPTQLPSPTAVPTSTPELTLMVPTVTPAITPIATAEQPPTPTPSPGIPPRGQPSPTATPTKPPTPTATPAGYCDLSLEKTLFQQVGTTSVAVTLTVQNRGTVSCSPGAVVSDPLPAGMRQLTEVQVAEAGGQGRWQCVSTTCTAGESLAPGYAANLVFTAAVEPGVTLENCARVTVSGDADPANDARCVSLSALLPTPTATPTPVTCLLGFEKAIQLGEELSITPGWRATLRIRVQNAGPEGCVSRWSAVVVSDLLPAGMRLQAPPVANDPRWECGWSSDALQCEGPPPEVGKVVTIQAELAVVREAATAQNCATLEPAGATACAVPSAR